MRIGFILSLPRSGSTFAQRVLSAAPGAATTSETWFLTSLFGTRFGEAPLADFAYDHVRRAMSDIVADHPGAEQGWRDAVAAAAQTFFSSLAPGAEIFIEKTPRNAVFAEHLIEAFPNSPVLILWRNPLAIVASINTTWGRGRWKAYFYHYDLFDGLNSLIRLARLHQRNPCVLMLRYEDLVAKPHEYWPLVFRHFGLSEVIGAVENPPELAGTLGDKTEFRLHREVEDRPAEAWTRAFGGFRKMWVRRYLLAIGDEDLAFMGYDHLGLLSALSPTGQWYLSDIVFMALAPIYHAVQPRAVKGFWRRLTGQTFAKR